MGFIASMKTKARGIFDYEGSQRCNSETHLPRKAAGFDDAEEDGDAREGGFFIMAGVASASTPRSAAPLPTTPPRPIYRSASVVVRPTSPPHAPAPAAATPPRCLLPDYKSPAQFSHKVELYKGSISAVYKALCTLTRTEVIIKQYVKDRMSVRAVHKMKREVRLMYMLAEHEGVAGILGDFEDQHFFYIIMEFCAGGDLYHRMILSGEFDERWACKKVIVPLLRVLHYIHTEAHIVHRDIKPENLFLTRGNELRLGDFGLAIKQDEELPFLRAGTLDYMAPEVLLNRVVDDFGEDPAVTASDLQMVGLRPYDEKVDVWAVGILAYELLVGEAPFYHQDEKKTVELIQQSNLIPFPARMRMSLWADFVKTALRKDPRQRPSAVELLAHPWVLQHSGSPLAALRAGLQQPLARAASLPALLPKAAAAEAAAGGTHGGKAQQLQQEGPRSVQVRVDASAASSAAPTAQRGAAAAGAEVAPAAAVGVQPTAPQPACGGSRASTEPHARADGEGMDTAAATPTIPTTPVRAPCCCEPATDDLAMVVAAHHPRASLAGLRRTRSTGEAGSARHIRRPSRGSADGRRASGGEAAQRPACGSAAGAAAAGSAAVAAIGLQEVLEGQVIRGQAFSMDAAAAGGLAPATAMHPSRESAVEAGTVGAAGAARRSASLDGAPAQTSRVYSLRRSEVAGDSLDLFEVQQAQQAEERSVHSEDLQLAPAMAAATHALAMPALPSKAVSPAAAAPTLPPVVSSLSSIAQRPKSHSLPKNALRAKLPSFSGASSSSGVQPDSPTLALPSPGSPCCGAAGCDPAGGSECCGQASHQPSSPTAMPVRSTQAGSRVLAAWGKKPSRLSVTTSPGVGTSLALASPPEPAAAGTRAAGSRATAGTGRDSRLGSLLHGSNAGTQEDVRAAKSGSINRLKLYLSRQRGSGA